MVSGQQIPWADAQRVRQSRHVHDGDVPLSAFDPSDVVAVQPASEAQFLLGPAGALAQLPDSQAHLGFDRSRFHALT